VLRGALVATALILIGVWMLGMPGRSHSGPLAPLSEAERATAERLRQHVQTLAGAIGERNMWRPQALAAAAAYIEADFAALGYRVERQRYRVSQPVADAHNIQIEIPGVGGSGEMYVIGAHYDSVLGSPGANDNATGVAALIELARLLRGRQMAHTVRLVAFVNEEPPFFTTDQMGSQVYARQARTRGERILGMLSLETMGYYSEARESQHYPAPLGLFYPDTGNFIAFVGDVTSRALVRRCVGLFRESAAFPSEGGALPGVLPGVGWSDHWSFWQEGYPALMVTDTAPYRYPWYHAPQDTPERLDYDRLARVTQGLAGVISGLASEE
jgi:Zn-dependent M28 family amino/carboxypeptidase